MTITRFTAAVALALAAVPAAARIVQIDVQRTETFAGGQAFGARGAYVKIVGAAKGELDPRDARNRVIVNIDKAPRNGRGKVEYEADFYILRPADRGPRQPQDPLRREQPRPEVPRRLDHDAVPVAAGAATIRARPRMPATVSSCAGATRSSGAAGIPTRRAPAAASPCSAGGDRQRRSRSCG